MTYWKRRLDSMELAVLLRRNDFKKIAEEGPWRAGEVPRYRCAGGLTLVQLPDGRQLARVGEGPPPGDGWTEDSSLESANPISC